MTSKKTQVGRIPELHFSTDGDYVTSRLSTCANKITNGFVGTATPFYVSDVGKGNQLPPPEGVV